MIIQRRNKEPSASNKLTQQLVKHPIGQPFTFEQPIGEGTKMLHRMRVELSRMRNYVKENLGRQPKQFKVLLVSVEPSQTNDAYEVVTVVKYNSSSDIAFKVVDSAFKGLIAGEDEDE